MKNKLFSGLVVLLCGSVFSDISNMEFVTIGNDGNATGGVDYHFLMGKYEVTASQWGTFVSTGGITHGYTQTYQSFDVPKVLKARTSTQHNPIAQFSGLAFFFMNPIGIFIWHILTFIVTLVANEGGNV